MVTEDYSKEDGNLCCCEYIDENGEKSHLMATFCNCDAVDEAFERLISSKGGRPGLSLEIYNAIDDRLRIPWAGGAKKISCPIFFPVILNPLIILLGSFSVLLSSVTYIVLLPTVVYCCHRTMKRRRKLIESDRKLAQISRGNSNDFYTSWLASTVVYLMVIYYTQVIGSLKISSMENLTFVVFFVCSMVCIYMVVQKNKGNHNHRSTIETSSTLCMSSVKTCSQGCFEVAEDSYHCKICGVCFPSRDHHCLWLNTCISRLNDRWFVFGLVCALSCLLYGAYLTFTTVCHPRLVDLYIFEVLVVYQCYNAYADLSSSLMISGGCYALFLSVCIALVLLQQVWKISRGLRRPHQKISRAESSTLYRIRMNWYHFWKD